MWTTAEIAFFDRSPRPVDENTASHRAVGACVARLGRARQFEGADRGGGGLFDRAEPERAHRGNGRQARARTSQESASGDKHVHITALSQIRMPQPLQGAGLGIPETVRTATGLSTLRKTPV